MEIFKPLSLPMVLSEFPITLILYLVPGTYAKIIPDELTINYPMVSAFEKFPDASLNCA